LSRIAATDKAPSGAFFLGSLKKVTQKPPTPSTPPGQLMHLKNSSDAIS
jgi:hypothetical protein